MAWGCAPSATVIIDTKMVEELFKTLKERYNKKTLAIRFPDIFDSMLSINDETKWEIWRSNNMQITKLFYERTVTTKKAIIFVNTHIESCYNEANAKNGERDACTKEAKDHPYR